MVAREKQCFTKITFNYFYELLLVLLLVVQQEMMSRRIEVLFQTHINRLRILLLCEEAGSEELVFRCTSSVAYSSATLLSLRL